MPNVNSKYVEQDGKVLQSAAYIGEFIRYLHEETGFKKESFTSIGVSMHLKKTAKTFYQLDLQGEALRRTISLTKIFTDVTITTYKKIEEAVIIFLDILRKIAVFLAQTYIGRGAIFLASRMAPVMAGFIIALYYVAYFAINYLSNVTFLKLKEWILSSLRNEKTQKWFDNVFGTFGRTIMAPSI